MSRRVALLAVALVATACTSHSVAPRPASTAAGAQVQVTGSLVRVGGLVPGRPVPVSGTIAVHRGTSAQGAVVQRVKTDADGRFHFTLGAGTYLVTGASPSVSGVSCSAAAPTVVTSEPVDVQVVCPVK